MATLFVAPTVNYKQTTLNGSVTSAVTTITVNSVANLQASGYIVIDRQDSAGNNTPTAREVVSYKVISGNDLTGCTRGADNSTAVAHNDGALVETMPTVGMWNSLVTVVSQAVTGDGYLKAINSPVSIAIGRFTQFDTPSLASIARVETSQMRVATLLDASGASITGIGLHPVWYMPGFASAATTNVMRLVMPAAGTFQFFTMMTRTPVSTASLTLQVNKNGTAIFDTIGRINILGGGTFASTASILTKTFNAGDTMTVDISTGGNVADITLVGRAA